MFNQLQKIKARLRRCTWELAVVDYNESSFHEVKRISHYHLLKNPYKTKWFADPFILYETNNLLFVLVEEFDEKLNRGRIAKLTVQKSNWTIVDCKILLDLPTHLSFPVIYRRGNTFYVHPENSESGMSVIYEYDVENDKFIRTNVVSEQPLTDAIVAECWDNSGFYMFTTKIPESCDSNLLIFHSEKFDSGFAPHSAYTFESKIARMAGNIINTKKEVIRPAQDCNGSYGKSVIFQQIDFHNGGFSFKKIGELKPPYWYDGLHTYNSYEQRIAIVDFKRYDFSLLLRCVKGLRDIKKYLDHFMRR